MATVLDLITDALVSVGELGQGETVAPEDAAFCLTRLNAMLDSMALERLYVPSVQITTYSLSPNKFSYQIGPGATDFNIPARPIKIESAAVVLAIGTSSTRQKLAMLSEEEYVAIKDQATAGTTPEQLYFDFGFPIATLNLFPAPTCQVPTKLELGTWNPISQFASINTTVQFPPGYYAAVLWNLCIEIMPGYDIAPNPSVQMRADEGKRRIASLNLQNLPTAVQQQIASIQQQQTQPPQQQ